MNPQQFTAIKWYFVSMITITIWSLLLWQYSHGGVPSHYFLQRADMPELSNWWGGISLPFLSWLALTRIESRILKSPTEQQPKLCKQVLISFVIALGYGAILSFSFVNGYATVPTIMFPSILVFALFFRVYREEFILGFILSMSITFGGILPVIFGTMIALASASLYFLGQFISSKIKNIMLSKPKI